MFIYYHSDSSSTYLLTRYALRGDENCPITPFGNHHRRSDIPKCNGSKLVLRRTLHLLKSTLLPLLLPRLLLLPVQPIHNLLSLLLVFLPPLRCFLFLLLGLCSLPVFAEVAIRALQYATGMICIERDECDEHGGGVEDVCEPFVLGNAAFDTRGELDEAVYVAVDDQPEDEVQKVEKSTGLEGRLEVCHMYTLATFNIGLFLPCDLELEADAEGHEDAYEKQL